MLFILLAEARGIEVPKVDGRRWNELLLRLKTEVAQAAGPLDSEVPGRIAIAYSSAPSATRLYDAVLKLVRIVKLLLGPDASGPEAAVERFLEKAGVPDQFLALALDRLARNVTGVDDTLVWVDFASVPVHHLDSMYESLLSLRVRVSAGSVQFENDGRGRKSTGSYYTPDHIVRCIVEQALDPPLAEHLNRFRTLLSSLSPRGERAGVRGVDDLFDFRVLDPAMGSGRFLVAAVNFIAERILAFLTQLHPTVAELVLAEVRRRIGIDSNSDGPGDLALLRQHVLERCIYGVDIDPLAVELAKMSLLLHCSMPGAPPARLHRRLKCGNALVSIGSDEVGTLLECRGQASGAVTSLDRPPEALRRLLDLYASRWFGSRRTSRGADQAHDLVWDFLTSGSAERWLRGGCRPDLVEGADRELVERSMAVSRANRFFHWEVEFPEAFLQEDQRTPRERRGFDAVIGNPPWGATMPPDLAAWARKRFPSVGRTEPDYFAAFLDVALGLTRTGGGVGLLLPDILLLKNYPEARRRLLHHLQVAHLVHWGQPFEGVNLDACSAVGRRVDAPDPRTHVRCAVHGADRGRRASTENYVEQGRFLANTDYRLNLYFSRPLDTCLDRIRRTSRPLGAFLEFHEGIHSGNIRAKLFVERYAGLECRRLLLRGSEVSPFRVAWDGRWVRYDRALVNRASGEYANLGRSRYFTHPKLLVRRTGDRIIAARDERGFYASNNFFVAQPRPGVHVPLAGLEMLLNSRLATWYFRAIQPRTGRLFAEAKITHLDALPVPVALTDDDWDWLASRARDIRTSLASGNVTAPHLARFRSQSDRRLLGALEISWQELDRAYPAGAW